jgi:predicted transcriptional regulator
MSQKNIEQCWTWLNCNLYNAKEIGIIGVSAICRALWKARNKVCFENIAINSSVEIVSCVCVDYEMGRFKQEGASGLVV